MSNLYCIYDKKTSTYLPPTVHTNDAEAMRMLDNAIKNNNAGLIAEYPDDYALYCVSEFNPSPERQQLLQSLEGQPKIESIVLIPQNPPIFVSEVASLPIFASLRKHENPN
ncbi:hypothetical protein [Eel River basin pequenovirus]|nr:hypothetical protein [Eel River basin pequenovirus]